MYFILYKDKQNLWRWTYRAADHEDICVSSESYTTKQGALTSIALVRSGAASAKVYDDTTKIWT